MSNEIVSKSLQISQIVDSIRVVDGDYEYKQAVASVDAERLEFVVHCGIAVQAGKMVQADFIRRATREQMIAYVAMTTDKSRLQGFDDDFIVANIKAFMGLVTDQRSLLGKMDTLLPCDTWNDCLVVDKETKGLGLKSGEWVANSWVKKKIQSTLIIKQAKLDAEEARIEGETIAKAMAELAELKAKFSPEPEPEIEPEIESSIDADLAAEFASFESTPDPVKVTDFSEIMVLASQYTIAEIMQLQELLDNLCDAKHAAAK